MYTEDSSNWSAFIAGAFIGAGVALLLAPQSGSELRSSLREYASRAKASKPVEGGKQALRNAGRAAREFVDESTQTAEKAASEATSRRG